MGGYRNSRDWGNIMATPDVYNLDHLGLVAGIIDQIGLVKLVNEHVGEDPHQIVSTGVVVKAMLLNGLGMVSAPLYLFSQFFEDKAIEKLLGNAISCEYLNDDKIGRVMDEIYQLGLTSLFIEIGLLVTKKFKIETKSAHLDSTSFHTKSGYHSGLIDIVYILSRNGLSRLL